MAAPHDRPTARELVIAVREFLAVEVLNETSGALAFHTRVAINILAMVDRELASATTDFVAHRRRLAALGCADDDDLVHRIRSGELDGCYGDVSQAIRAAVADKLRVVNPKYAAPDLGGSDEFRP